MKDRQFAQILEGLTSRQPQEAWAEFLEVFSPLILQLVRLFEREPDHVADCFLFVCQQLSRKRFRRLRCFRPEGPAAFSTWLRAVVRNLCLDWHRKEFGRQRIFESIARLPGLDREVFHSIYEQGIPLEEVFLLLRTRFPSLTMRKMSEIADRIQQSFTPRQRWLMSTRNPKVEALETHLANGEQVLQQEIPDTGPDPEALAILSERRAALARALSNLGKPEGLLIRLRFEQGLTLEQLGRVTKLGDAQSVDRKIKHILERLRKTIT